MMKLQHDKRTTILSLSWRDIKSPKAGGAEVHTHEMLRRLDAGKYRVVHISMKNPKEKMEEVIDGVTYIRKGNALTVILFAIRYYAVNHREIDFVIDQCNTHRFFTPLWVRQKKRIFYIHQLTKEIWDYSAGFPLNRIGKMTEEMMLKLNRKDAVITVSESTRQELIERGYQKDKIKIIHNGISFQPWSEEKWCNKEEEPTFIYAGRYSPYKGIDKSLQAFAGLKQKFPKASLWILGKKDQEYVEKNLMPICRMNHLEWCDAAEEPTKGDIISWGYVSEEKKLELLSRAWVLLYPSIREGWGIPITEAGCVGTPSIAFDSPGIREAVWYGQAGYLCKENTVDGLYQQMKKVICDKDLYEEKKKSAYDFSSQFLWDRVGRELDEFLENLKKQRKDE